MVPDAALVERFRADLDALIEPSASIGLAVSGGPDSLALLLLAAASRPGQIEAATVDHGLREGSREEADAVAGICERLGVPHAILAIEWDLPPTTAIQEQARTVRYGALAQWMGELELTALLTAHHLDDQAETLMMRLNRGSGVRGLGGMRPTSPLPNYPELRLLRPLLGWRRAELEKICADAQLSPAMDPSNADERHERVRVRRALASADWLDPEALARSARNIAAADEALDWAAEREWSEFVAVNDDRIVYRASTAPKEIIRRVVARAIAELGTEGDPDELRGRELDRLIDDLQNCNSTTLRGVRCLGGLDWTFSPAPPRAN
jgi:tRNA(Ile)-lysidine synthase